MPSVPGKGSGGRRNEKAARNGKKVGRPAQHVTIRISVQSAAQLQQLMLTSVAGVSTPEQMVEHLIQQATPD